MRILTLLLLSLSFAFMSCGDDDDETPKTGNCLTAVVNGENFEAETTTGIASTITIEYDNLGEQETRTLIITGTIPDLTGTTKTISLSFACAEFTSELNTVDIDSDCGLSLDYTVMSITNPADNIAVVETMGVVNVQEVSSDRIKGTFSFSGEDQNGNAYTVTDGFFDTSITQ